MAQIILITSGTGGAGKSTSTALLGRELAKRGEKTLLLEPQASVSALDLFLGTDAGSVYDLGDLLNGTCCFGDAATECEGGSGLFFLPAPRNRGIGMQAAGVARLIKDIAPGFDYILFDVPAAALYQFKELTDLAGRVLLVVTPDPLSVRNSARAADMLFERGMTIVHTIINMVPRDFLSNGLLTDLDVVIDDIGVPIIGVVPRDVRLAQHFHRAAPLSPQNIAGLCYKNIAARLMGEYVELLVG